MRYFVVISQLDEEDDRMDEMFRIEVAKEYSRVDAQNFEATLGSLLNVYASEDWYTHLVEEN